MSTDANRVRIQATLIKFAIVGLFNTCITLMIIFAAKFFWNFADAPANALGYFFGLINGFVLNRRWTFSHKGAISRALPLFLLVQGGAYVVNMIAVLVSIDIGIDSYLAHIVGMVPYVVLSYAGSRWLVFPLRTHDLEA